MKLLNNILLLIIFSLTSLIIISCSGNDDKLEILDFTVLDNMPVFYTTHRIFSNKEEALELHKRYESELLDVFEQYDFETYSNKYSYFMFFTAFHLEEFYSLGVIDSEYLEHTQTYQDERITIWFWAFQLEVAYKAKTDFNFESEKQSLSIIKFRKTNNNNVVQINEKIFYDFFGGNT